MWPRRGRRREARGLQWKGIRLLHNHQGIVRET